jgi:hypothetical protein
MKTQRVIEIRCNKSLDRLPDFFGTLFWPRHDVVDVVTAPSRARDGGFRLHVSTKSIFREIEVRFLLALRVPFLPVTQCLVIAQVFFALGSHLTSNSRRYATSTGGKLKTDASCGARRTRSVGFTPSRWRGCSCALGLISCSVWFTCLCVPVREPGETSSSGRGRREGRENAQRASSASLNSESSEDSGESARGTPGEKGGVPKVT